MAEQPGSKVMTRRQFLTALQILAGTGSALAAEAVASVALEHPEWDMAEERTVAEWCTGD